MWRDLALINELDIFGFCQCWYSCVNSGDTATCFTGEIILHRGKLGVLNADHPQFNQLYTVTINFPRVHGIAMSSLGFGVKDWREYWEKNQTSLWKSNRKASLKESSIINYICKSREFLWVLIIQTSGKFLAVRRVLLISWLHRLLCHRNMRKQFDGLFWGGNCDVRCEERAAKSSFHKNETSCSKLMNKKNKGYQYDNMYTILIL